MLYRKREGKSLDNGGRRVRAGARGDEGGEASGEVGTLSCVNDRVLGGGVGRESNDEPLKNESVREPADLGGGADERRGVASVSSSGRSRDEGCDVFEASDGERVSGGGGRSSDPLVKGDAKNAFVFLPLEVDGVGEGVVE